MAAQMVASASFMRRHRDGLAGGFAGSRGGRVRDLPGNLFGDDGDDQPCVDPRSRQLRLLGRQHVEAGQALEPFERQLDLPAKAIEGEDVGWREGVGRQRGQEPTAITIVDAVLTPVVPVRDDVERLPEQRMEGMRDLDGPGHLPGVSCS